MTTRSRNADKAFILTGPTSGMGRETALHMATSGTLILVGRSADKLNAVGKQIRQRGGNAVSIVCDFADLPSVRRAAAEIVALGLPLAGLLNNAGIQNPHQPKDANGWDLTFLTNHLGPFLLTEKLLPHLQEGARVLFVGSATEDPDRGPARRAGFRGGRYLSAEASLRGEWRPGGSANPGMDAYATYKQCNIVTALALARENPQLHINALEPGIMFATGLHSHMPLPRRLLASVLVPILVPFVKVLSTPKRAARVVVPLLTTAAETGVYFDESGHPMQGSAQLGDPSFQERVVAETRTLLATLVSQ